MVRAAVSGALDYSRSDPTDINWRLKQKLVLQEIQRREEVLFLTSVHQQWLAYLSHGGLTEESFKDVKTSTNSALDELHGAIFPWREKKKIDPENDTIIDTETQRLVDQYKAWQQQRESEAKEKPAAEEEKK
jgi:hypothetical protein